MKKAPFVMFGFLAGKILIVGGGVLIFSAVLALFALGAKELDATAVVYGVFIQLIGCILWLFAYFINSLE